MQLARWSADRTHVDLIGRQTQLFCNENANIDSLVRQMIHDDAFRDETASLGCSKIRVFKSLSHDLRPIDEVEPFYKVFGLGTAGTMPLIVTAPHRGSFEHHYQPYYMDPLGMPHLNYDLYTPPKRTTPLNQNDLLLEEKRRQDRIRQRKCRARKKVCESNKELKMSMDIQAYNVKLREGTS